MATKKDVEVIIDEGDIVSLESGTRIRVLPLKTRQFFKLLRIITHGAGGMLLNLNISSNDSPEEFGAKLFALVGFAVPDAEDEAVEFIMSIVEPETLKSGRNLSKDEKKTNEELSNALFDELYNPELGDTLSILETVVKREAEDLQALGKRLMTMFSLAQKTGQIPVEKKNSED